MDASCRALTMPLLMTVRRLRERARETPNAEAITLMMSNHGSLRPTHTHDCAQKDNRRPKLLHILCGMISTHFTRYLVSLLTTDYESENHRMDEAFVST
jgi:hypothetical protein